MSLFVNLNEEEAREMKEILIDEGCIGFVNEGSNNMGLLKIAQRNFAQVIGNIDDKKYPQEYRESFGLPLWFYLENSVDEAKDKILSGINKDKYELPSVEERQKLTMSIRDRIVKALQTDMSGYDAKIHGDYNENVAWNIVEEFCK